MKKYSEVEILKILGILGYNNTNQNIIIEKSDYGVANQVYIINVNDKKYVLKIRTVSLTNKLSNYLQKSCLKRKIPISKLIKKIKYENHSILLYEYIEGTHVFDLQNGQMDSIVNLIFKLDKIKYVINNKEKLSYKINKYYAYLKKKGVNKFDSLILNNIIRNYENLISKYNLKKYCKYVIHADLSPTNILWNNDKVVGILDFDEAIIASREYELAVIIMKFCIKDGKIDIEKAKQLINAFVFLDEANRKSIQYCINIYVIKVLLEKIYLYEIDVIDLEDERQKKDDWRQWYKLLLEILENKLT